MAWEVSWIAGGIGTLPRGGHARARRVGTAHGIPCATGDMPGDASCLPAPFPCWNGAALIPPRWLSHPRSSIPSENSLGSCHHRNGLPCSGSSTSSQATELLPTVSLFTSHLRGSRSSVPQTRHPASGEEQGEIPHRSWAQTSQLGQDAQRTCVLAAGAGQWPHSIPISQLAAGARRSRNSFL